MNAAQRKAFSQVFKQKLTLIQGPPGTGKTTISAYLAHANVFFKNGKVLISSHSNQAVDNICIRIIQQFPNTKIVRVLSRGSELNEFVKENPALSSYYLHRIAYECRKELKEMRKAHLENTERGNQMKKHFLDLLDSTESLLLPKFDIICATCITAGDKRFTSLEFNLVIVDEATQCIEPYTLIPFAIGASCRARHLVLVGDQCQLGPVVQIQDSPISISLFERLVHKNYPVCLLTVGYKPRY
ncbi:hypothetical protein Ciccas_011064 [Cichlidogyrus casuarinus]|uniref:DNA2/NAM7 helicase helicase domain-containing protein n=1 Tax=Cichlidogyrus casuarinus TaxID=1844966 RepID=A0ABD2PTZ3_9PLAT